MTSSKLVFKGRQGYIHCFILLLLLLTHLSLKAQEPGIKQDTLSVTIHQADKMFLEQNLELIAQHYQIETGKALALQAKLWDDPILTTDQNIYAGNKWLEHGTNPDGSPKGQYFVQLEQLIKTAGKRRKLFDMAQTNVQISEWQFNQVMQNLKYELHNNFYRITVSLAQLQILQEQYRQLEKLQQGMESQYKAGNIARKDLLRVEALQLARKQDITEALVQLEDYMSSMRSLLGIKDNIFIQPLPESGNGKAIPKGLPELIDSAQVNNASFQLERYQLLYQQRNFTYQRSLAVPDITIAPSYDLNSNYAPHYVGLGISLPLPLFNGNKGNIKAAGWQVKQQETSVAQASVRLNNEVTAAYNNYYRQQQQLNSDVETQFFNDYGRLYENIAESFRLRQISMLEFIDYFNDYKEIRMRQLQQELNLRLAAEELNLQVGTDIFNN